jgi:superfamily II DNA/RNA helicase
LDHISRGTLDLGEIDHVVLDEGDTMLEMGFQDSVEAIIANVRRPGQASKTAAGNVLGQMANKGGNVLGQMANKGAEADEVDEVAEFESFHERQQQRKLSAPDDLVGKRSCQFLLFSATMPSWIAQLTEKHMEKPVYMNAVADGETRMSETISHYSMLLPPLRDSKDNSERNKVISRILEDVIVAHSDGGQAIVFVNTREEADKLSVLLGNGNRRLRTLPLHGDVSQGARQNALEALKAKTIDAIVATDVAARGLDIAGVDLVVHCKAPLESDTFVHRSGRTGRAGRAGKSILLFANGEHTMLSRLERELQFKFAPLAIPSNLRTRVDHVKAKYDAVGDELAAEYVGLSRELLKNYFSDEEEEISDSGGPESEGCVENMDLGSINLAVDSDTDTTGLGFVNSEEAVAAPGGEYDGVDDLTGQPGIPDEVERILCRALAAAAGSVNQGTWYEFAGTLLFSILIF